MYCDSICAFISNFAGSKGPYGDCRKPLCHRVCKNLSALCIATWGSRTRCCLPRRTSTLVVVLLFKKVHRRNDWNTGKGASVCVWDGKPRSEGRTVILFGRAAQDKHGKEPPQSLCIPLTNFDFAGCTNNWVRKWLRLLFRFSHLRNEILERGDSLPSAAPRSKRQQENKKNLPWLVDV